MPEDIRVAVEHSTDRPVDSPVSQDEMSAADLEAVSHVASVLKKLTEDYTQHDLEIEPSPYFTEEAVNKEWEKFYKGMED